jgi:7-carboxy-7-deazaguanine synthase
MGNAGQSSHLYKINEIFYSLQGEGFWQGTPAVFLRFSDCNLRCPFCDTEFLSGKMMSVAEILENIAKYPARRVIFTGGEPLMNDTFPIASALKSAGYMLHVETNGMFEAGHELFDWITVSPKNSLLKITHCDEAKVVLGREEVPELFGLSANHYFISPKNPTHSEKIGSAGSSLTDAETLQYCIEYVKQHPHWRLSVQLHKYLGIQ